MKIQRSRAYRTRLRHTAPRPPTTNPQYLHSEWHTGVRKCNVAEVKVQNLERSNQWKLHPLYLRICSEIRRKTFHLKFRLSTETKEQTKLEVVEGESQIETEKEDYLRLKSRMKECHRVEPGDKQITKLPTRMRNTSTKLEIWWPVEPTAEEK